MAFDPGPKFTIFPERAIDQEPGFTRYQPLLTPADLKETYLFGIPLRSNLTGEEMGDDSLQKLIDRATSEVEHELRINITPVTYEDRYDYNLWDYSKYNFIQLKHWPVIQVIAFKGKYPNTEDFLQFPTEWLTLDPEVGMFRVTPTNGQITQFFLTNGASYLPLILGSRAEWPHLWEITYVSGFQNDKVPAMINDLIGYSAAIKALNLLTTILFPYGSYSIGIDGTSQSISSPGPEFLVGRVADAKEQYDRLLNAAKNYYNKQLVFMAI